MASKFYDLIDNIIYPIEDIDNNLELNVISIIGKARTGKSTLLNLLISKLLNKNSIIFETSNKLDHCTKGINKYLIKSQDKQYLILDVQGIEHLDSSKDGKLLLFVYLISDLIIYNEKNMLSNSTLNSLLSLTTFIQCMNIKKDNKPNIIFRIADLDLDISANDNLNRLLDTQDDQYQNIRDTIKLLFKNINAYHTEVLNRYEKIILNNNLYLSILDNPENKFNDLIENIMKDIYNCNFIASEYNEYIKKTLEMINENSKINHNELDIEKLISEKEILEWKDTFIDNNYYLNINVNAYQEDYDKKIEPNIKYLEIIIKEFNERFKNVPENIKSKYLKIIIEKLQEPINNAIDIMSKKTQKIIKNIIKHYYKNYIEGKFEFITNNLLTLENMKLKFEKHKCVLIDIIEKEKLYNTEAINYISYITKIFDNIINQMNDEMNSININLDEIKLKVNEYKIPETIIDEYFNNSCNKLHKSYNTLFNKIYNYYNRNLIDIIESNYRNVRYMINVDCESFDITIEKENIINVKYSKIVAMYNELNIDDFNIDKLMNEYNYLLMKMDNYRYENINVLIKEYCCVDYTTYKKILNSNNKLLTDNLLYFDIDYSNEIYDYLRDKLNKVYLINNFRELFGDKIIKYYQEYNNTENDVIKKYLAKIIIDKMFKKMILSK